MAQLSNDSHEQLALLIAEVLGPIRSELKAEVERLRGDVTVLRSMCERVERTALSTGFQGVWHRRDEGFEKGALVVHDGEIWAASSTTFERPGTGSWRKLR